MKKPAKPARPAHHKGGGQRRIGGGRGVVAGGGSAAAPVRRKGTGKGKGGAKPKHHRHHHPKRKLSAGDVACCSAEALAALLRLAGHPVGDSDVLALYWATASDAGEGASILATLEAAAEYGLAGVRPLSWKPADFMPGNMPGVLAGGWLPGGPHAVTLDGAWAWTWGERRRTGLPFLATIDEAWEVRW